MIPAMPTTMLAASFFFICVLQEGNVRELRRPLTYRNNRELRQMHHQTVSARRVPKRIVLVWDGERVRLADPDERMLLLAARVFRLRFGDQWPVDTD